MAIKVEKQSRKIVKPSVPTPPSRGQYKISFIDGLSPEIDLSVTLFFPFNNNHSAKFVVQLEKSLEKTLTRFYPLAGRYVKETQTVSCNDEGAELIHAKVNITLEDFLGSEMNVNLVDELIPIKHRVAIQSTDLLLAIQVTTFECGGVAIGVSATHKIGDAFTLSTFLNEWAAMNREDNEIEFTGPGFNGSSLFPARGVPPGPYQFMSEDDMVNKFITKRISFSESEILNMKEKAITSGKDSTRQWSKEHLVSAVIWKALIGVDRAIHNNPRESILLTPTDLRGKMASLIPKNSCGNLAWIADTKSGILETTKELAVLLNDSVKKSINTFSNVYHDSEEAQMMVYNSFLNAPKVNESTHMIAIGSWCNYPFYEADFGFGKPIWVAPSIVPLENFILLMDGPGGNGVEAYVVLEVKDVPYFEKALDVNAFSA